MTGVVFAALVVLAVLDAAFSGFRASLGRTGLVDHVDEDRRGLRRGAVLFVPLSVPAVFSLVIDLTTGSGTMTTYRRAALAFLAVVGPYALIVVLALVVYAALGWELRYLASAMVLGPFTLLRPYVTVAAAIVAINQARTIGTTVTASLAVAAVLLVEPILDRRYRTSATA